MRPSSLNGVASNTSPENAELRVRVHRRVAALLLDGRDHGRRPWFQPAERGHGLPPPAIPEGCKILVRSWLVGPLLLGCIFCLLGPELLDEKPLADVQGSAVYPTEV